MILCLARNCRTTFDDGCAGGALPWRRNRKRGRFFRTASRALYGTSKFFVDRPMARDVFYGKQRKTQSKTLVRILLGTYLVDTITNETVRQRSSNFAPPDMRKTFARDTAVVRTVRSPPVAIMAQVPAGNDADNSFSRTVYPSSQ